MHAFEQAQPQSQQALFGVVIDVPGFQVLQQIRLRKPHDDCFAQLAPGHGTQASSGANLLTRPNRACGGGLVRKTGTRGKKRALVFLPVVTLA